MSIEVFTFTETMEVHECPTCHMRYAAPSDYFQRKSASNSAWKCPEGHEVVFRKSDLVKAKELAESMERQRDFARSQATQEAQQRRRAEYRERAQKAAKTRIKNRIAKGVCPCCKRHFTNLERHIAGQHPEWNASE